ncbi:MAG: hypothetical protein IJ774_05840 [Selenomonadaceae bacterium]|nr:hypothetical protein [Selenomonadaceae bacterium]MBR1805897.1 hypothetical protein [Selenomonadaceae bacterium]
MKHSIRQRVINEYGLPVTKIETVTGELGSGIFDKNGKEIFEGDRVVVKQYPNLKMPVSFSEGEFYGAISSDGRRTALATHQSKDLEIVGHVGD